MFGMWDVGCGMFVGMWDVDLQNVKKIKPIKNGKNISNDADLCNIFNDFFSNVLSEINIPKKYHCFRNDMDSDSVLSLKCLKITQALRISKVKSSFRHFLLRILTLMQ